MPDYADPDAQSLIDASELDQAAAVEEESDFEQEQAAASSAPKKQGYMFAPHIGDDTVNSIFILGSVRVANEKDPYPVVVPNAAAAAAYDQSKAEWLEREKDYLQSDSSGGFDPLKESVNAGMYQRINDSDSNFLSTLDPENTKLYIVGHGEANVSGLLFKHGNDRLQMTMPEVVDQLVQAKLDPAYRDIRLLACEAACKPGNGGPTNGQRLQQALAAAGFTQATVTAYRGEVSQWAEFPDDWVHKGVTLSDGTVVRASEAREIYLPAAANTAQGESDEEYDDLL